MAEKTDAPTSSSTDAGSGPRATDGASAPKAIIKNVDMSEEMQQESVDIASAALEKYNIEKDIAAQIKKEFDRRHGPTWHVVVGKNFGSYVTHGECLCPARWDSEPSTRPAQLAYVLASPRNQTFHLFLRWLTRYPHLEVIKSWSCGVLAPGGAAVRGDYH